ncbi:tetratricopeptide repeat protein [Tenacibaculum agarivorans]|uniref:tetratricopeptide repeat protein n=1 Tax=Tenacibaculum agarivorans TaxID=1908389 RepID=UPI00094BA3F5|nr:hypothetical protein [Tenacibaculum agarivorans]
MLKTILVNSKTTITVFILLSTHLCKAQNYKLNHDKVREDSEKLLLIIEKTFKNTQFVNFQLNSDLASHNLELKTSDKKHYKKLLKKYKANPDNEDILMELARYYKVIKNIELSKKIHKKSLDLLTQKKTINDSIKHYIKLALVKKELGLNFDFEGYTLINLGLNSSIENYKIYEGFLLALYLGYGKYEMVKEKTSLILNTVTTSKPEIFLLGLVSSLILEKGYMLDKNDLLLIDTYSKRYKTNKNIQNIAKLTKLLPFLINRSRLGSGQEYFNFTNSQENKTILKSIEDHLFRAITEKSISTFSYHYYLGQIYFFKNDNNESINHFKKAMKIAIEDSLKKEDILDIFETLISLYGMVKNYPQQRKILEIQLQFIKDNNKMIANNFYKKALIFLQEKKYKEAYIWTTKARRKTIPNANTLALSAFLEFKKNKHNLASNFYMIQAIKNITQNENLFKQYLRLTIYSMILQQTEDAFDWFKKASKLAKDKNDVRTLYDIRQMYFIEKK